jgi:4-amino-4-deoxy-L-arabinose transferase-like glycosyltransferase
LDGSQTGQRFAPSASRLDAVRKARVLEALALAAILGIATALRVVDIARIGFNSDEAVYAGQGAALTGDPALADFFSIFRAHPLLLQLLIGGLFKAVGVSDVAARLLVSIGFGVGSVLLAYLLARKLFGVRVALAAALLLAVIPYHVLVSRQVLVDVPFGFFVLLTLWLLVRSSDDPTGRSLIPVYVAAGLAVITKEIAVLLLPLIGTYLLLTNGWQKLRLKRVAIAALHFGAILAPFVLSRLLFSPGKTSGYVSWQFSRPSNHRPDYFFQIIIEFGSVFVAVFALLGLFVMARRRSRADLLIGLWLLILFGFFQLWPTKLFAYLFVVFPAFCICAAVGLDELGRWLTKPKAARRARLYAVPAVALGVLCSFLASESLANIRHGPTGVGPLRFDLEVQDFAGGREFGRWAKANTPADSVFLTIGPSMGNILAFYGHRESLALSISSDVRRRNPAYVPVRNPDLVIRRAAIQYAVWDFYSADRSAFYNGRLMRFVRKYDGEVVFAASRTSAGKLLVSRRRIVGADPLVVVYDLAGGAPQSRSPLPSARERHREGVHLVRGQVPGGNGPHGQPSAQRAREPAGRHSSMPVNGLRRRS